MIKKYQNPSGSLESLLADILKKQTDVSKQQTAQGTYSSLLNTMNNISSALPQLDHTSTANTALEIGSQVASMIPGSFGMITSLGLKGVNLLDQALGKNSKTQATLGETATGRDLAVNTTAGTKYGGLFGLGKRKKSDNLTNQYDIQNIAKIYASNKSDTDNLAAINSAQSINNQNFWKLQGGIDNRIISAEKGSKIKQLAKKFQKGGQMNVIPEGAFHSRKNNLDLDVTPKGIPVISKEDGGEINQHAEVERDEITFNYEFSKTLEEYTKKYNDSKDESILIELGKLITFEILENTKDNSGLIDKIKE